MSQIMYISDNILAVFVGFILTELAAFVGFVWKANQFYQRDRDANKEFFNDLKLDLEAKVSMITMSLQKEASSRERSQIECRKEVENEIQKIKYQVNLEKEMTKRSIDELKEQIGDLVEKVDKTQESVEFVHRRIDELFRIIQSIKVEEPGNLKSARKTKL